MRAGILLVACLLALGACADTQQPAPAAADDPQRLKITDERAGCFTIELPPKPEGGLAIARQRVCSTSARPAVVTD